MVGTIQSDAYSQQVKRAVDAYAGFMRSLQSLNGGNPVGSELEKEVGKFEIKVVRAVGDAVRTYIPALSDRLPEGYSMGDFDVASGEAGITVIFRPPFKGNGSRTTVSDPEELDSLYDSVKGPLAAIGTALGITVKDFRPE